MPTRFLDETACSDLRAGCLFYPSAGLDTKLPLATFLRWIRDFWFVDQHYDLSLRFSQAHHLEDDRREILSGTTLRTGETFQASVRHERYSWSDGSGMVTIHRCRGRGYDVFRTVFSSATPVSVFFHRGDSRGEGGSNFYWLGRKRIQDVLTRLEPNGLIVSDGSNAMRQFRWTRTNEPNSDRRPPPFEAASRRFVCVGHLGRRYGPTFVWKTATK